VTELVAKYGIAGNWLWWNMVMSGILTVFFFARLWRRANVMTDVELAEVRYGGRPRRRCAASAPCTSPCRST
jgi:Na+/proline symporter